MMNREEKMTEVSRLCRLANSPGDYKERLKVLKKALKLYTELSSGNDLNDIEELEELLMDTQREFVLESIFDEDED